MSIIHNEFLGHVLESPYIVTASVGCPFIELTDFNDLLKVPNLKITWSSILKITWSLRKVDETAGAVPEIKKNVHTHYKVMAVFSLFFFSFFFSLRNFTSSVFVKHIGE